jgi:mxaK protein
MSRAHLIATWLLAAVILAGATVAGPGALQLWQAQQGNRTISALAAGHDIATTHNDPGLVLVARARFLIAKGDIQAAQALADDLANAPPAIRAPLLYAIGNAHMRRAYDMMRKLPFWKVKPTIALAKSEYRQAIQVDPDNWDARYNYAVAASLVRDTEQAQPTVGEGMAHERAAWPDIPGAPNGMP